MANHTCDECQSGKRSYADGYVYRDWSGCYTGDPAALPAVPDPDVFWTYVECKRNAKKLMHINLDGKCSVFAAIKK